MDDYYAFRTFDTELAGRRMRWTGKPGVPGWNAVDAGRRLLAETIEVPAGGRALDLGCGTGLVGAAMARSAGEVLLADTSVPAVACAQRTLEANGIGNARAVLHTGVPHEEYDVIAASLPRGTLLAERLLREAGAALRPGGRLYLAGHKLAGIKTFIDRAAQIFGAAHVLKVKAGYRVAIAQKHAPIYPPADDGYVTREVVLRGERTILITAPGVFAWERLDAGTRALVEHMRVEAGESVVDLGCGAGLAGLAAARLTSGRVVLLDADARATASAVRTLEANGYGQVEVLPSDCGQVVLGQLFDVVVSNPPFHQGRGVDYDVALQFIADARALLRPGGRLYLVANAFLPYERELARVFGRYETMFDDRRFKVLQAE